MSVSIRTGKLATRGFACLALIINTLIGGVLWWPLKKSTGSGAHPVFVIMIASVIGLFIILALRPRSLRYFRLEFALWIDVLISGLAIVMLNWGLVIGDVISVTLLFFLNPFWTLLLLLFFRKQKLNPLNVLSVFIAFFGVWLIYGQGQSVVLRFSQGEWLGLFAGIAFAINGYCFSEQRRIPVPARAFAMFLGAGLVSSAALLIVDVTQFKNSAQNLSALQYFFIGTVAVATVIANVALQFGISKLAPQLVTILTLLEVFFAVISSCLILRNQIPPFLIVGASLIVFSVLLLFYQRYIGRHQAHSN